MECRNLSYEKLLEWGSSFDFDTLYDGVEQYLHRMYEYDKQELGFDFKFQNLKLTTKEIADALFLARRRKELLEAGYKMGGRKSRIDDILPIIDMYKRNHDYSDRDIIFYLTVHDYHYKQSTVYKALKKYKQTK